MPLAHDQEVGGEGAREYQEEISTFKTQVTPIKESNEKEKAVTHSVWFKAISAINFRLFS